MVYTVIGDLIFCYVTLTKSRKRYYYLADKEYQPGEEVLVPVDSTNIAKQIQKATVKRTIFCPPENAPYPIEKIKKSTYQKAFVKKAPCI